MRIAQIATLAAPVARESTGSVEGLVWLLAQMLTGLGHEVTTFAAAGSEVPGELVATLPGPYAKNGSPDDWQLCEWINLGHAIEQSGRFDVLHSHAYLWGMLLDSLSRAPMLHTLHVQPHADTVRLCALYPKTTLSAVSRAQWRDHPSVKPLAVIHHGVDPAQFTFRAQPEDYVCYLGRIMEGKGPVDAIECARALGLRLVLAGPRIPPYYRECVASLVDGRTVEYIGPVRGSIRDQLLGGARALLYPVRQPEPFGLVLVEAMMCGTPVAAMGIGAVPEIVDEGVTGCCATSLADFPSAVLGALKLDREAVRQRALARFTADRMAREYVRVYEQLLEPTRTRSAAAALALR